MEAILVKLGELSYHTSVLVASPTKRDPCWLRREEKQQDFLQLPKQCLEGVAAGRRNPVEKKEGSGFRA